MPLAEAAKKLLEFKPKAFYRFIVIICYYYYYFKHHTSHNTYIISMDIVYIFNTIHVKFAY